MKNQHNFKWSLIFIICITIIPFKSVKAQFGNYFLFEQTYFDDQLLLRQPSGFMQSDTTLKHILLYFDPAFDFNHFEYINAAMMGGDVKKIKVTARTSVND